MFPVIYKKKKKISVTLEATVPVVDPGFPVLGVPASWGVPTPNVATFHKICVSKQKNQDP